MLALHVKSHSLQDRNVLGNVLIVEHHVKKKVNMSGFDKRYLQKFLATVSFEACSVLDNSFFFLFNDLFSTKIPLKAAVDSKTCV